MASVGRVLGSSSDRSQRAKLIGIPKDDTFFVALDVFCSYSRAKKAAEAKESVEDKNPARDGTYTHFAWTAHICLS